MTLVSEKGITLNEVQKARIKLESDVMDAIRLFSTTTGLPVESVEYRTVYGKNANGFTGNFEYYEMRAVVKL